VGHTNPLQATAAPGVEAISSCVASWVASPRSQRRVAARFNPVQHSSA